MVSIMAVRSVLSRRFPVCSFAVRVAPRHLFEIACATHPRLFHKKAAPLRARDNFFSTRSRGFLRAPRGHAVVHLPPEATHGLAAGSRIYYVLVAYPDLHAAQLGFDGAGASLPFVRVAPELRGPRLGSRALSLDDDRDFTDMDDDEQEGSSAPPAATLDARLAPGMVVWVEIRDGNGTVTPRTHEYPVDSEGGVRLPGLARIDTRDMKVSDLRAAIGAAVATSISGAAINVLPSDKTVGYGDRLQRGDRLYLRVLGADGVPDPASGVFSIDAEGILHLPVAGDVDTANLMLKDLEAGLDQGFKQRRSAGAVAHVSKVELR